MKPGLGRQEQAETRPLACGSAAKPAQNLLAARGAGALALSPQSFVPLPHGSQLALGRAIACAAKERYVRERVQLPSRASRDHLPLPQEDWDIWYREEGRLPVP